MDLRRSAVGNRLRSERDSRSTQPPSRRTPRSVPSPSGAFVVRLTATAANPAPDSLPGYPWKSYLRNRPPHSHRPCTLTWFRANAAPRSQRGWHDGAARHDSRPRRHCVLPACESGGFRHSAPQQTLSAVTPMRSASACPRRQWPRTQSCRRWQEGVPRSPRPRHTCRHRL